MNAATFTADMTPPIGHPLCGGWIAPAREIVDPLFLHGLVLVPDGQQPIVIGAIDWCWIMSEAHHVWRERLAEAAGTQPNRVALQCVHQHDAPMADPAADRILAGARIELRTLQGNFLQDAMARSATALREAMTRLRPVTHIGTGQAQVDRVAANRRVLGADGKVKYWRGSACRIAPAKAQPEGFIDSWLKTIGLWDNDTCVAALHYYATHPMSYYGQGGVSCDFVGQARERLRREQQIPHFYFTGCAGNVSAGKYNDGSREMRPILSERIHDGMKAAFANTRKQPLGAVRWSTHALHLPMSREFTREYFDRLLRNEKGSATERIRGAMGLAWWDWHERGEPIELSALHLGDVHILHLPAESFIEYQLYAQQIGAYLASTAVPPAPLDPHFVAVAAYGDCGPAYIPTAEAYPQGAYETTMAWVSPEAENVLKSGIRKLLNA